jgi:hypothetical protein
LVYGVVLDRSGHVDLTATEVRRCRLMQQGAGAVLATVAV